VFASTIRVSSWVWFDVNEFSLMAIHGKRCCLHHLRNEELHVCSPEGVPNRAHKALKGIIFVGGVDLLLALHFLYVFQMLHNDRAIYFKEPIDKPFWKDVVFTFLVNTSNQS
jgi:hypothetical protein